MKLRIISDLHLDVNEGYPIEIPKSSRDSEDIFTLIAGDISGDPTRSIPWVEENIRRGAIVAGNHLVYNRQKLPLEDLKQQLHKAFPLESDVTFFDDDVGVIEKEIAENILLLADVMYTDYQLLPVFWDEAGKKKSEEQIILANMKSASPRFSRSYLNDFVHGTTRWKPAEDSIFFIDPSSFYARKDGLATLCPEYYLQHHRRVWKKMQEAVERNPEKDIIILTHHCLSEKCISSEYVDDILNASYVSKKDEWIASHKNIRLVVSGHVHHRTSFKLGNAIYVTNPLGYCSSSLLGPGPIAKKSCCWSPEIFVDTKTWKLASGKFDSSKLRKVYEKELEERKKLEKSLGTFASILF